MRAPLLPLLLLLAPALAGCTLLGPPIPPPGSIHPALVQQAYVVSDVALSVDSPFANVRATGRALAVAVTPGGAEGAAVFVGPQVSWRADAIFQTRERPPGPGDAYVQPPAGEWAALRERQSWVPASEKDLSDAGFPNAQALFQHASKVVPQALAAPEPGLWFLNGTVSARFDFRIQNVSLATAEGPFVFQRNASGFIAVENRTIITWREAEHKLDASNAPALVEAQAEDPQLAALSFTWSAARIDVRVRTPSFRVADLEVTEDKITSIINVELPRVAHVSMVRYLNATIEDDRVEVRSQNITLLLGP